MEADGVVVKAIGAVSSDRCVDQTGGRDFAYANGAFFNPRFATPRAANGDGAVTGATLSAGFVRHVGRGRSRHSVLRATREVRFSQRPTVRGTLTAPSGQPIANATVFIGQQPEGEQRRLDGAVRTDSAGEFVCRPAARHPNRRLQAVYFPFSDSHEKSRASRSTCGFAPA